MTSPHTPTRFGAKHTVSRILHKYADWRIAASEAEKHCHKPSDTILLTFDDYGTEAEVHDILQILAAKRVKAMFFLVGTWATKHPELVHAIEQAGHVVGNHTYSHANLLKCTDREVLQEISSGLPGRWLRAPQGRANRRIGALASSLGFSLCYWTIDSRDWTNVSIEEMRHTILSELQPGAVILFHIHGRHTRQALPQLIDDIRDKGYELTAPSEDW